MRTVLVGSDFMYDKDGNLRPIELNTAIGWTVNKVETDISEILDSSELISFINSNSFTKITYIGDNVQIKDFLKSISDGLSISFQEINVPKTAITVPFIEDSDDNLIIRTAYDTTAILDEEYCKNKVNFLNLIKNTEFGSQFAYMDETGLIVNNITEIKNNNNHPNFILKAVYPSYDKNVYPKLYKVGNQEELDVVLENVNSDYFLMEYHINESKFHENNITKIRKLSLLYPPTLQSIHIGSYTDLTLESVSEPIQYNTETFELATDKRYMYITKDLGTINLPKLMDDDYVVLSDNTLKSGLDLQVGDVVKTINIPNIEGVEIENGDIKNYNINFNTFQSGVTYNSNTVTDKKRIDAVVRMCNIEFEDETNWTDTINSKYLVLSDGLVKFKRLDLVEAGDTILLINTNDIENVIIEQKIVSTINITSLKFSGWVITVENTHLFLTKTAGSIDNSPSFAAIEHNDCAVACGKWECMTTYGWAMKACG